MTHHTLLWAVFGTFIVTMLALDLGVFHRKAHEVKLKEAILWSVFWVVLAFLFGIGIFVVEGAGKATEFFTGYLIEQSLSIDNIFVFIMIFKYFRIPARHQHGILFWGILGAIVLRAAFVFAGVALISRFHWIIYVFGAFLIFSGIKMALAKDEEVHPDKNLILKLIKKFIKISPHIDHGKFFIKEHGKRMATPLLVVLIMIEASDVIFALDSVPAILAISQDTFIVYTSNIFAILGLRAMYFAIAGILPYFHFLHYGLTGILSFVGVKMLISDLYKIPTVLALGAIAIMLILSVVASLIWPAKKA